MKLGELARKLQWTCLTPGVTAEQADVRAGYVSDLLSDVIAHAPAKGVLVTVQVHLNVVAVAVHAELSAVVFAMDRGPEDAVLHKAVEEGIALYRSKATAFELVGRLYELGVRGPEI